MRAWKTMAAGWFVVLAGTQVGAAQTAYKGVAERPPLGWNSWDAYGLTITEPSFRANVAVQKEKLASHGWEYSVIDEGWFFENPRDRDKPETLRYAIDPYGRYVPVPARFPSAVPEGMKPAVKSDAAGATKLNATIENTNFTALADWVHAQGLKFGIHIVRGIPRVSTERNLPVQGSEFHAQDVADTTDVCPWDPTNWGVKDNAAGQAWYDSLLRQYAAWGIDFLKVDCISNHPYKEAEIRMIRKAIDKTGRPIVLSLSPGPTSLEHAAAVSELSNMWRIADDHWDLWDSGGKDFPQGTNDQFARLAAWEKYAKPGSWPDADMLPIGELRPAPGWGDPRKSRLTPDEVTTEITLWAIARSPMILGANLTLLDDATVTMLDNRFMLATSQTATESAQVYHQGALIAWKDEMPGGRVGLAIFNTGETPVQVDRPLAEFDESFGAGKWTAYDVWSNVEMGKQSKVVKTLPPHGCVLLILHRAS
jgi:alpha-galactosidase